MNHFSQNPEPATMTTEARHQRLTRLGLATPRSLQGVYPFAGRGFFNDLFPGRQSVGRFGLFCRTI